MTANIFCLLLSVVVLTIRVQVLLRVGPSDGRMDVPGVDTMWTLGTAPLPPCQSFAAVRDPVD